MNMRVMILAAASFLSITGAVSPATPTKKSASEKSVLETLANPWVRTTTLVSAAAFTALWAHAQHKYSALGASTYKPRLKRSELTRALDLLRNSNEEDKRSHEIIIAQLDHIENVMKGIAESQSMFNAQRTLFGCAALIALGLGVAPAWRDSGSN